MHVEQRSNEYLFMTPTPREKKLNISRAEVNVCSRHLQLNTFPFLPFFFLLSNANKMQIEQRIYSKIIRRFKPSTSFVHCSNFYDENEQLSIRYEDI